MNRTLTITELKNIFGSFQKAQEIFLLLADEKKVVRQGFYENETGKIIEFCKKHRIYLVKSRFKIILTDAEKGFSNIGIKTKEDDERNGMIFLYLSKDEKSAYLASYYEIMNDSGNLGRILEYPECCIDFFLKNWSKENSNPEHEPTNPYTNITRRNDDLVLISHFPCSSECKKSIALGKRYYNKLKGFDEDHAEILYIGLSRNIKNQMQEIKIKDNNKDQGKTDLQVNRARENCNKID